MSGQTRAGSPLGYRAALGVPVVILSVVVVLAILAANPSLDPLPACANLVPVAAMIGSKRRFQIPILSPTWLSALVLSSTGFFGYVYSAELSGVAGGGIQLVLPPGLEAPTAYVFAAASGLVVVGAYIVLLLHGRPPTRLELASGHGSASHWTLAASIVPLLMVIVSLGPSLLQRDQYLDGSAGSNLFGLGQQLAVAVVPVLGYRAATDKGAARVIAMALSASYLLLFFSLGSRRLALVPLCFAVGFAMAKRGHTLVATAVASVLSLLMLPLPLYMRGLSAHGLLPYAAALPKFDLGAVDWVATLNNVLVSFPITGFSAFATSHLPLSYLAIGVNPLPGDVAGWYQIARNVELNAWTPFSMVGESANYGMLPFVCIWAAVGLLLGVLEIQVAKFAREGAALFSIAIVGLSGLFALQALQYGLRASTRMLEYAAIAALVGGVFVAERRRRRDKLLSRSTGLESAGPVSPL